jgi:cystathionine beta-lyase
MSADDPDRPLRPATMLARIGSETPAGTKVRTLSAPLQRGSTVLVASARALYDESAPTYGMNTLAGHDALRSALAALEGADHIELFSSGLSACTGAIMAAVDAGDEILASDCLYGPTRRFLDRHMQRFGVTTRYAPADASAADLETLLGPKTRLLVLESPGSLTFEMQDIPAIAAMARKRGVLTMVDNTWAAGLLFRPLDHGVDFSVQALTKYVCGHSDVFLGSVATRNRAAARRLASLVRDLGASTSPDDVAMALRGLRTLAPRLERHDASGRKVASFLAGRPEVAKVLHPALPSDPGHALWLRDFKGACGLFGVVLRADAKTTEAFLDRLTLFGLGFSWGGYESLAINCDPQLQRTARPFEAEGALVRLHVGLEDPDDLIDDLKFALKALAPD